MFSKKVGPRTPNTANGTPQSGSMSSYRVSESAELALASLPVMDNQTASCDGPGKWEDRLHLHYDEWHDLQLRSLSEDRQPHLGATHSRIFGGPRRQ